MRKTFDVKLDTFGREERSVTPSASQIDPGGGFGHAQLCEQVSRRQERTAKAVWGMKARKERGTGRHQKKPPSYKT